ncbi:hypothetical protein Ga0080559_TMP1385 [Salipiger profundus]|uniref:Uncharacterized protein n=1 Tax=Salipiger profundus TaxID=1229727 RepID=A0A1U7D211_9RHOB|nr:hypothetical protein Ga0080559_TMP1385 [Salipiger profundus]
MQQACSARPLPTPFLHGIRLLSASRSRLFSPVNIFDCQTS